MTLTGVGLDWPPATAPPVYVGAVKPRTLELAGALADGTILTGGTSAQDVRAARTIIDGARTAAGRTDSHEVVVYLVAATGDDAAQRIDREARRWSFDASERSVSGDADEIAAQIGRWVAAGADTVVLQPTLDDPDPAAFVRFVGEQVAPLVS